MPGPDPPGGTPAAPADEGGKPRVPAQPATPDPSALDAEVAAWKEKALRARADYDNLQKRVARDAALERERAKARVLDALLPLHELARMAAHQAEHHPGPMSEGVVLLAREFTRLLEREGLSLVDAVGVPFDATMHEAVATEAVDGVAPGHVARIVQAGYLLDGKVLRYAKVAVAPSPPAEGGAVDAPGS